MYEVQQQKIIEKIAILDKYVDKTRADMIDFQSIGPLGRCFL